MNDRSRVLCRPRRAGPRPARTATAIIAAAALALLAVACGSGSGSPPSAGSGGSPHRDGSPNSQKALAYSRCMRSHGVPKYPDPGSSNALASGLPKPRFTASIALAAAR
jgi:hypothetical protein